MRFLLYIFFLLAFSSALPGQVTDEVVREETLFESPSNSGNKWTPPPPNTPMPTSAQYRSEYNKKGFSVKGKWVVPHIYQELPLTYNPNGMVAKKDGVYGIIDGLGRTLVPFEYKRISAVYGILRSDPENPVFILEDNESSDLVTASGKSLALSKHKKIEALRGGVIYGSGLSSADQGVTYFRVNGSSKEVKGVTSQPKVVTNNMFRVSTTNGAAMFDSTGQRITEFYEDISAPESVVEANLPLQYIVKKNGKYGVVDVEEATLIPFEFESIYSHGVNLYSVKKGNKQVGLYRIGEGFVLDPIYDTVSSQRNGNRFYSFSRNSKQGALSRDGKILAPAIFADINELGIGLLAVRDTLQREYQLYLPGKGIISQERFNDIRPVGPTHAVVTDYSKQKVALYDLRLLRYVTGFNYDRIRGGGQHGTIFAVERNGMKGFIDVTGTELPGFRKEK